jgi:hypothetical protein
MVLKQTTFSIETKQQHRFEPQKDEKGAVMVRNIGKEVSGINGVSKSKETKQKGYVQKR